MFLDRTLDFDLLRKLLQQPGLWEARPGAGIIAGKEKEIVELLPCHLGYDGVTDTPFNIGPVDPVDISAFQLYFRSPDIRSFWHLKPRWFWRSKERRQEREDFELALALWCKVRGTDTRSPDERLEVILKQGK